MDIFLNSLLLVGIGEIGDKTQLLAMVLACRYRKPLPIIFGILIATTLNHGIAAWVGEVIGSTLDGVWMQWLIALSFIAIGFWVLKPDTLEENPNAKDYGAFLTTLVLFFVAEIGDKTQLVTVALAAQYQSLLLVLLGTTAGMLIVNLPAVFCGNWLMKKIPVHYIRYAASLLFIGFGFLLICRVL